MYTNPTNPPMTAASTLPYSPVMQQQAVATLLLIENSQAMSLIWADLRDRYLPSLVTRLESAELAASNNTLVLESLPLQSRDFSPVPRQYDALQNGLCDVQFNCDPGNRISVEKIWSGVDFLASKFQGQPAVRHLIVVAASTPQYDTIGVNAHANERSPWQSLAQSLAQAEIQCHIVLGVNEDMGPLMTLFEETLKLQNLVEEPPSFPVDHGQILFRLSARSDKFYSVPGSYMTKSAEHSVTRRHHTSPSDSYIPPSCMKDEESSVHDSPIDNPPSLVTQLQQVHGLTKKKVYGTKPARLPFFREERVRDRYRKGTTSISASATATTQQSSAPNGGGRGMPRSRAERSVRGSPTESHPRHPGIIRRMSAPDPDILASPTTFSRPCSLSSPISPTSPLDMHMPATPLPPSESDIASDPSWLQQRSVVPSLPQSQISGNYPPSRWHGDHSLGGVYSQHPATSDPPVIPPFIPSTLPKQRRQELGITRNSVHEVPSRPARNSRSVRPEDEEPFTFGDDYVAQTAALFENEVLPGYPNFAAMGEPLPRSPTSPPIMDSLTPPRCSFYIAPGYNSLPPSPSSYNLEETYPSPHQGEMGQQPLSLNYATVDSPLTYATTYSPGSNSSLTGWAG